MSDTQGVAKVAPVSSLFPAICSLCDRRAIAIHPADGAGRCGGHVKTGDLVFDPDCIELLDLYRDLDEEGKSSVRRMLAELTSKKGDSSDASADALPETDNAE